LESSSGECGLEQVLGVDSIEASEGERWSSGVVSLEKYSTTSCKIFLGFSQSVVGWSRVTHVSLEVLIEDESVGNVVARDGALLDESFRRR